MWLPSEPTNGPASKEFVYAPAAQPAWIKTRQLKDAATSSYLEGWGYFDGFGRSLQSQAPLANGNRSVTSTGYNALGQTAYSSAAYEVAGAAGSGYVAPTWTNLANYAYTTYDELGRTVRNETRSGATQLWATPRHLRRLDHFQLRRQRPPPGRGDRRVRPDDPGAGVQH